jgi:hypothetical protein
MKFIFKAILFAVIFSTNACKKQDATNTIEQTAISEQEKLSITNYLNSRKTRTDDAGVGAIDTVLQQINWERYYVTKDKSGNKLTVFELKNYSLHGMSLLLYTGKNSGKYGDAQLAIAKNKEGVGKINPKLIADIYAGNNPNFTGEVEYFKVTKEHLFTHGYKNGRKEYTRAYDTKKRNSITEENCYEVYLITYWNDGTTTADYLYSYCVSDCPNTQPGGSIIIGTGIIENTERCGSSSTGGNGTGGTNNNSECTNLPTAAAVLNSSYSVSEVKSTTVGEPFFRPNLGVLERYITKNWTFYKGTTVFGIFYLSSTDRAIQRKLNNGSGWYFTRVEHITHGVSSSVAFVKPSITNFAATSIVHSYTRAEMRLDYGVNVKIMCQGILLDEEDRTSKVSNLFF